MIRALVNEGKLEGVTLGGTGWEGEFWVEKGGRFEKTMHWFLIEESGMKGEALWNGH